MYELRFTNYSSGKWFWDLRRNGKTIVMSDYAYSTKSNAKRAFHRVFRLKPSDIKEIKKTYVGIGSR